ncbi:excalibur domain-containing protein [Conexibacter stalactiti]|uniref:Excalibur domain-containing protein n=1 Tax=Conexibacter stalactiti TaxID=1940611 RepID=A0ABU4HZC6_9ACTN|nr:excalibur domain-containing protein [Conexibacter stalactiti]MDW5598573.1 excalibur domain-containing protein [Conexibacter stalactiti]MEC5039215.1 excalibur domain-containing protein [Conexibacter stalactiti]
MRKLLIGLVAAGAAAALAVPAGSSAGNAASTRAEGAASGPTAAAAKRSCHPNYRGRCLKPNASDYDCAGGSGNGPYYVSGPFRVVGSDPFRLDSDRDGIACEK